MHGEDLTPRDLIEVLRFYGGDVFVDSPDSLVPNMCIQAGEVPEALVDQLLARSAAVKTELRNDWEITIDRGWDSEDARAA